MQNIPLVESLKTLVNFINSLLSFYASFKDDPIYQSLHFYRKDILDMASVFSESTELYI